MSKVPDLQKLVIVSAAVSGIGFFWWQTTRKCFETILSIADNQFFVYEKRIRKQIENVDSLIQQVLEDQKLLEDEQAVQAGQDVQDLKNKIIVQMGNICSKAKKMEEDFEDYLLEKNGIEWEIIKRIRFFCSHSKKLLEELDNMRVGGDEQDVLFRLGERKQLEDEKISLLVKGL